MQKAPRSPRLDPALWADIRRRWEFDPDSPSFSVAASRSAAEHAFTPPGKTTIHRRAHADGWVRRGSMAGVNIAAHFKADALVNATVDGEETKKGGAFTAEMALLSIEESEVIRAEIVARHRTEWETVRALLAESLEARHVDPQEAFNRAKLAKITAEITALKQAGERRAWNLDAPSVIDFDSMTDAQLEALAYGKPARR